MKKILLVLMLAFAFILPGCSSGGSQTLCSFAGRPNGRYTVGYPDGFLLLGEINSVGSFTVPKRGYTCGQLVVQTGPNYGFALSASPASVYLPSPPASGTITGQSFDATYGMPEVDYFDSNGYLIGAVYATSMSADGTWLQANLPNLSNAYSGTYQIKVTNKTSSGYYLNIVGAATITATGRDRADTDGDGWYDDEDCDPYDPNRNYDCNQYCNDGGEGGYYPTHQEICPY
jgi:hypothetical protein